MINQLVKLVYLKGKTKEDFIKTVKCGSFRAFRYACANEHLEVAKLLLEPGFVEEQVKILKAVGFRHYKIKYKDLVEKGIV